MKSISGVIVTYNPELHILNELISSLVNQVDNLIIINNGDKFDEQLIKKFEELFQNEIVLKNLELNSGIAFAQNLGVSISNDLGAKYTLLLDQDSKLTEFFVSNLVSTLETYPPESICAVGPILKDTRTDYVFPNYTYRGIWRKKNVHTQESFETDHLISSGTIIKNSIFLVSPNNPDFFIEYVDIEWCMRLRNLGYKILCNPTVVLEHQLGDERKKILGIELPIHKPERYFFVFRNGLYCNFYTEFPFSWKVYNFFRLASLGGLLLLGAKNKRAIFGNIIKGIISVRKLHKKR